MARLVRLDQTGHTTLAEWSVEQPEGFEAAVAAFRDELDRGYFGIAALDDGTAHQVRELPFDASTVILRRPIAGG